MAPRSLRTQDFEVVAKQRDPRALPRDPKKRTSALGLPRCRRVYIESKLWEWISGCWDRGRGLQDTAILAGQVNLVSGCLLGSTGSIRLPFSATKKNKLSAVPYSQLFSTSIRLTTRNCFPIIFLQALNLPTLDERDSNNILHPLAQAMESHDGFATYGNKEIWHFLLVLLPCVSVLPATFRNVSVRTMNDHHHEKDKVEPRERTPGIYVSIAGLWMFFRARHWNKKRKETLRHT